MSYVIFIKIIKHNSIISISDDTISDFFADKELGWTSWELYNFVLIGLTNELVELGVTADIKITVLELWARYLGKLEVAFTSTKRRLVPKLARSYKKRLLGILSFSVIKFLCKQFS